MQGDAPRRRWQHAAGRISSTRRKAAPCASTRRDCPLAGKAAAAGLHLAELTRCSSSGSSGLDSPSFWNVMVWRQVPLRTRGWWHRLSSVRAPVPDRWVLHHIRPAPASRMEWPKVEYLVTDKRLVILSGLFSLRQVSKFLDAMSSVDLKPSLLDRRTAPAPSWSMPDVCLRLDGPMGRLQIPCDQQSRGRSAPDPKSPGAGAQAAAGRREGG